MKETYLNPPVFARFWTVSKLWQS